MGRFVARRLLLVIPYLFAAFTLVFVLSRVVPADPVRALIGVSGSQITEAQVESMKKELGLDRPVWVQYGIYLKQLTVLDLGKSFRTRRPVLVDLGTFFPATLELTLYTAFISTMIGLLLGVTAAISQTWWVGLLARILAVLGSSTPLFWVGLLFQLYFYGRLNLLPFGDRIDPNMGAPTHVTGLFTLDALLSADWPRLGSALSHLVLPTLALSLMMMGLTAKVTQEKVKDIMRQDFVRTARAKGVAPVRLLFGHVMRNLLVTLVNIWGLEFGRLLGGAVAVEAVFSFPGIGQYAVDSIIFFDFPSITGITLLSAVIFLITGLVADVLGAFIDPRIRYS